MEPELNEALAWTDLVELGIESPSCREPSVPEMETFVLEALNQTGAPQSLAPVFWRLV